MTDRELMQQALEALELYADYEGATSSAENAITALRERLAQPEQEPVAWRTFDGEGGYDYRSYDDNENYAAEWAQRNPRHVDWVEPLYTAPPRREWVGLTLEEIGLLTTGDGWAHLETPALALFARAIEAKLKEKNA